MRERAGEITENSRELVAAIINRVLACEVNSLHPIQGLGMSNSVTVASTDNGRYVVRTNLESHLFRYQREAWCFEQLSETDVLTPHIIACGVIEDTAYSVAEFIGGSAPLSDFPDSLSVWRTLGSYARTLNEVSPPIQSAPASSYFPMTWSEQVREDVAIIFKDNLWQERVGLTESQQDSVYRYLSRCESIDSRMGICQFDISPVNAVICDNDPKKIYLLDLEWANVAPVPFYQLACVAASQGASSEATRSFFEGYGAVLDEEQSASLERFTLYRLMRAAAWARDRCPGLLDENIRRTETTLKKVVGFLS